MKIFILSLGFVLLTSATILFFSKAPVVSLPAKQYQVTDEGQIIKVAASPVATNEAKQSMLDALEDLPAKKDLDIDPEDAFAQWAVLENRQGGYRLIYPYGFNISYDNTIVEVSPPKGEGKITVYVESKSHKVVLDATGVDEKQSQLLLAAKNLITNSFEFLDN